MDIAICCAAARPIDAARVAVELTFGAFRWALLRIARCAIEDFRRLFIDKIMAPDSLSFTPKGETTRCRILIGDHRKHTIRQQNSSQPASLGNAFAEIPTIIAIIMSSQIQSPTPT
jgi:hypothetical protein